LLGEEDRFRAEAAFTGAVRGCSGAGAAWADAMDCGADGRTGVSGSWLLDSAVAVALRSAGGVSAGGGGFVSVGSVWTAATTCAVDGAGLRLPGQARGGSRREARLGDSGGLRGLGGPRPRRTQVGDSGGCGSRVQSSAAAERATSRFNPAAVAGSHWLPVVFLPGNSRLMVAVPVDRSGAPWAAVLYTECGAGASYPLHE
jgi:hypothetical protein